MKCIHRGMARSAEVFTGNRGFQQRAGHLHKHMWAVPTRACAELCMHPAPSLTSHTSHTSSKEAQRISPLRKRISELNLAGTQSPEEAEGRVALETRPCKGPFVKRAQSRARLSDRPAGAAGPFPIFL